MKWVTGSETNNDYFEILASVDGKDWTVVQLVQGSGTTTEVNEYHAIDYNTGEFGYKYYRIKQVDYDGTTEYFGVRRVDFTVNNENEIRVFENNGIIQVSFKSSYSSGSGRVDVIDVNGRTFAAEGFYTNEDYIQNFTIDKSKLFKGIYLVRVVLEGKIYSEKIIVR